MVHGRGLNERLGYAINMVATSERHVLPKQIPEIAILGGPRRPIRPWRFLGKERAGHDRHGEQKCSPEKGAFPATKGLGPRGQVDPGVRDVPDLQ